MKLFKKVISLMLSIMLVMSLVSCGGQSNTASSGAASETTEKVEETNSTKSVNPNRPNKEENMKKTHKIGIIQLVQHAALDASYQGFVDYLNEKGIKFTEDLQNASGEQSACETIAEKFANDGLDLCYAIATPAAQSVVAHLENVPIVASAVTDPAGSGLCKSNDNPQGMLTAASDLTPVEAQFDLLVELLPNAKNVGILYCSAEANSKIQADMAIEAATKRNLDAKEYTVVNSNDIQTVIESMIGKVDVIYVPTDNTISAGFDTVATICNENKIPTIVGEEAMVDKGGFATYGINYYQLGKLAGQMAEEILINKIKPGDMAVRYLDSASCTRKINEETAKILGIEVK
ncbi:MAG: ABC transporter substrate-binding protein [Lachnospiraceae bacterium]|nr:ABC transporter substrate-binding protein [Lachnospiraceae bacterium]